ncbi:MAG TPA: hypothetical protein VIK18_25100, partial [Pirellulales bacterium]
TILVCTVFAIAITGLGVFYGLLMDGSLFPPSGGGWRCYVDCVIVVWVIVLVPGIPFGAAAFARWLTDRISG